MFNTNQPVSTNTDPEIAAREANREVIAQIGAATGQTFVVTTYGPNGEIYAGGQEISDRLYYASNFPSNPVPEPPQETVERLDSDSEAARFIQWQSAQVSPTGQRIGEIWAQQGISDPYSNKIIVETALEQIARQQAKGLAGTWNDPDWPKYQGSTKEAWQLATAAQDDPAARARLIAENNWSIADYESWSLRVLDPEAWDEQAAAASAAAGFVYGPSGVTNAVSPNGQTLVSTAYNTASGLVGSAYSAMSSLNQVDAAAANLLSGGIDNAVGGIVNSAQAVADQALGAATGAIGGALGQVGGIVNSAQAVASSALAGFQSAAASLSSAQSLISGAIRNPPKLDAALSPFVQAAQSISSLGTSLTSVENTFSAFGEQFSTLLKAKNQATLQSRYNQASSADWRVRLQLGPDADYLYKAPASERGILGPLFDTDGVIFPYLPSIETSYAANYDKYDLVHSNYRGYFYKGSVVNDINIRGTFTAQDTQEANYVLAVIHFFRSVTKMFYGQDAIRGAPPPLVFLSGLGDYQFNDHPCLVASFNYSLPNDVDYIRAVAPNNYGNLFSKRERTGASGTGALGSTATRLINAGLDAINPSQPNVPTPTIINNNVNNLSSATYVPTKIEINITLLPTNTRSQVSQQFSVKDFANGKLIKGGFW